MRNLIMRSMIGAVVGVMLATPASALTSKEILAASKPAEWRRIDPAHTLYLDLAAGRVVIELAPGFAPNHVANVETLVRAGYFDHAFVVRSQDNYVVQWSQPDPKAPTGGAAKALKAEFDRPIDPSLPFDRLPDPDSYAPEIGFAEGMPAARDPRLGRMWLVHCYGTVAAARDVDVNSGSGSELYAVNGEAPRILDRNLTVVGRVIKGMALLSSLPRGTGDLGFYKTDAERVPILRVRIAADVPEAERVDYTALRTDSPSFKALVAHARTGVSDFFKTPAGGLGVCDARLPIRPETP